MTIEAKLFEEILKSRTRKRERSYKEASIDYAIRGLADGRYEKKVMSWSDGSSMTFFVLNGFCIGAVSTNTPMAPARQIAFVGNFEFSNRKAASALVDRFGGDSDIFLTFLGNVVGSDGQEDDNTPPNKVASVKLPNGTSADVIVKQESGSMRIWTVGICIPAFGSSIMLMEFRISLLGKQNVAYVECNSPSARALKGFYSDKEIAKLEDHLVKKIPYIMQKFIAPNDTHKKVIVSLPETGRLVFVSNKPDTAIGLGHVPYTPKPEPKKEEPKTTPTEDAEPTFHNWDAFRFEKQCDGFYVTRTRRFNGDVTQAMCHIPGLFAGSPIYPGQLSIRLSDVTIEDPSAKLNALFYMLAAAHVDTLMRFPNAARELCVVTRDAEVIAYVVWTKDNKIKLSTILGHSKTYPLSAFVDVTCNAYKQMWDDIQSHFLFK